MASRLILVVRLGGPVHVDGTVQLPGLGGASEGDNYYAVDTIHTAIREKRQLRFQYIEFTAKNEKILKHDGAWYAFSPYALMWQRDYYYAVGWSDRHDKLAQFRVDRMVNVELLEQPAMETPDFDAADYASKVFGMYDDKIETVTLRCENEFMRNVIDRFGDHVQTEPDGPDHFIARVDVAPVLPFSPGCSPSPEVSRISCKSFTVTFSKLRTPGGTDEISTCHTLSALPKGTHYRRGRRNGRHKAEPVWAEAVDQSGVVYQMPQMRRKDRHRLS